MKRILVLVSILALSFVASKPLLSQENPFLGTWKLNVAKSRFTGSQPPRSETRIEVAQGSGETVTYEGIAADGSPISWGYTSNLDGQDAPISGRQPNGADALAIISVDANTRTAVEKKTGKTLYTVRGAVSKDGKVLTQTTKGINGDGVPISITLVWDKQ